MKSRFLAIVLMLILLTSAALPGAAQTTPTVTADSASAVRASASSASPAVEKPFAVQEQFIVRGRVLDASGKPQPRLRIEALYPGGQAAGFTHSEKGGRFTLTGVEAGAYLLRVVDDSGKELPLSSSDAARVAEKELQRPRFHELVLVEALTENLPQPAQVTPQPAEGAPALSPGAIQGTGQITGVVTAQDTGLPLQNIYINLFTTGGDYVAFSWTDSDGNYNLPNLDTGDYLANFYSNNSNYLPEWYDGKPDMDSADPVHVVDGSVTPDINASMQPGGQISGTVTAADTGLPLHSVYVYAYDENGGNVSGSVTDANGDYLISKLPTGDVYVGFFPSAHPDYLQQYYNGKPDLASADPVHVNQGSLTGGIDAALARGGQITGQVTADDTGLPLQDVQVSASEQNGYLTKYAEVDANGVYTVSGLLTGSYRVYFAPHDSSEDYVFEYYDDTYDYSSADLVAVVAPDLVSGIDASLARGGKITGQVTASDTGLPLQDISVQAEEQNGAWYSYTQVDANGMYTLTGLLTGNYRVNFSPYSYGSSSDYLREYYDNKYTYETADLVPLVAPDIASNIDASLERGGKITGQVTAQVGGDPIANVYVTLYTDENDYRMSTYTNASGVYTFTPLMSGGYKLRFDPYNSDLYDDFIPEYYDNKLDIDDADIVQVTAPDTTSGIDAALAEGGKIAGVVTAADTHLPLEDVQVYIYNGDKNYISSTGTNASGQYTLTQLASGSYYLYFSPGPNSDYIYEYYNGQREFDDADPVAVVAPDITSGINANLDRGGSLTGRVTGEDSGLGLLEVSVSVLNCYGWYVDDTVTDGNGYYTFTGLIPGGYSVNYEPWESGVSLAYLEEFYDNKPSWEESTTVTVASGEVTPGIDAALTRGGQIRGAVTAADGGAGLEDVYVDVFDSRGYYMGYAWTDASGVYTTTGLASGDYYLLFAPYQWSASRDYISEYYNNQGDFSEADPVQVTAPNIASDIDAVLQRGGRISGRVTAEGSGTGLGDLWVDVYHSTSDFSQYTIPDSAGYYTVYGLRSGNYRVSFDPYGNDAMYVWEYYNNKNPYATVDEVSVSAPNETGDINAELSMGGGIPCIVRAEDTNEPLEDVYVTAYDSQGNWWSSDWTDQDGECLLEGLPSGDYRVGFDSVTLYSYDACLINRVRYVEEYYDDKPDLASADPISVAAPGTTVAIEALLALGAPLPPIGEGTVFLPMVSR